MDNKSLKQWVKLTSKIKKLEQEKAELLEALKEAVKDFDAESVQGNGEYRTGLYCGLEDMNITDRYETLDYGYERALERVRDEIIAPIEDLISKSERK